MISSFRPVIASLIGVICLLQAIYPSLRPEMVDMRPVLTAQLGTPQFPCAPEIGTAVACNISALHIESLADIPSANLSPVVVLENGVPLGAHGGHDALRGGVRGHFRHWESTILISPTTANYQKNRYTLVYPQRPVPVANIQSALQGIWIFGFACALLLLIGDVMRGRLATRGERAIFVAILAIFLGYQVRFVPKEIGAHVHHWGTYLYEPDSDSYIGKYTIESIRPPFYIWFVNLTSGRTINEVVAFPKIVGSVTDGAGENDPFVRVVRAQKIVLILSILTFAWVLSSVLSPPVVVVALSYLAGTGYLSDHTGSIMSETIAQSWMFLILAAFLTLLRTGRAWWLVPLAVACGGMFLTRSAAIYGVWFLASGIAWLVFKQGLRRSALPAFASLAVCALLYCIPGMYRYFGSGFYTPAPMYADALMPFALQFADQQDVDRMPTRMSKRFLREALRRKPEQDERRRKEWSELSVRLGFAFLSSNLYLVAHPAGVAIGLGSGKRGPIRVREVFQEVSTIVLKRHWREYLQLARNSFFFATSSEGTRLKVEGVISFWGIAALCLVVAALIRGPLAWFSVSCIIGHLAHLAVISHFDAPIPRYVYATEPLVLIAIVVLSTAAFSQLLTLLARRFDRNETLLCVTHPPVSTDSSVRPQKQINER